MNKLPTKLRFSPYVWSKIVYLRDKGHTEISGFGISKPDDLLLVTDFVLVKQKTSAASISLDAPAIASFIDEQLALGRKLCEISRIWIHTHPGNDVTPSDTDENTFRDRFGGLNWAIMCIVGKAGAVSARLKFNVGVKTEMELSAEVDYSYPFSGSNYEAWNKEYADKVEEETCHIWKGNTVFSEAYADYPEGHQGNSCYNWGHQKYWNHCNRRYEDPNERLQKSPKVIIEAATEEKPTNKPSEFNMVVPEGHIPLMNELEKYSVPEAIQLIVDLDIDLDEIDDYSCYHDEKGDIVAELIMENETDERESIGEHGGFVDQAGKLMLAPSISGGNSWKDKSNKKGKK